MSDKKQEAPQQLTVSEFVRKLREQCSEGIESNNQQAQAVRDNTLRLEGAVAALGDVIKYEESLAGESDSDEAAAEKPE